MADEAAKIAVAVEVNLAELTAGLNAAQAQVTAFSNKMATQMRLAGTASARALVEPYSMIGDTYDLVEEKQKDLRDSFAYGIDPSIPAGFNYQMEQVNTTSKKTTSTMQDMARLTANIGRGLAIVQVGTFAVESVWKSLTGTINDSDEVIRSLPFGLGKIGELLIAQRDLTFGITQEYKDSLNPAIAEQNRLLMAAQALVAQRHRVEQQVHDLQIQSINTDDEYQKAYFAHLQERAQAEQKFREDMDKWRSGEDRTSTPAQIETRYMNQIEASAAQLEKVRRDMRDRIIKEEEEALAEATKREADTRQRGEHESAVLIERNRREARQQRYRETLEEIARETRARQQQQDELNRQLSAAQGVNGSNFVSSISTGLGSFRVAQQGAGQEVARAQIRSAQLLAKIADNTRAMAELADERDFVSSLR